MGDPRKQRKQYEKPARLWDSKRIEQDKALRGEFGLKNAREVWKAQTILRKLRREARRLLAGKGGGTEMRSAQLLKRVQSYFIAKPGATLDDILILETRDILARRLQTIVLQKGMALKPAQARQFITHGHIAVADQKISAPSTLIKFSDETDVKWYGTPIKLEQVEKEEPAEEEAKDEAPAEVKEKKPVKKAKKDAVPSEAPAAKAEEVKEEPKKEEPTEKEVEKEVEPSKKEGE